MKTALLLLALLTTPLMAFEPERIVVARGEDFSPVTRMLNTGWTVKAQSSVATLRGGQYMGDSSPIHIFTLTPPSEAVKAEFKAKVDSEASVKAAAFFQAYLKDKAAKAAQPVEAGK